MPTFPSLDRHDSECSTYTHILSHVEIFADQVTRQRLSLPHSVFNFKRPRLPSSLIHKNLLTRLNTGLFQSEPPKRHGPRTTKTPRCSLLSRFAVGVHERARSPLSKRKGSNHRGSMVLDKLRCIMEILMGNGFPDVHFLLGAIDKVRELRVSCGRVRSCHGARWWFVASA
jgi:hypothetical protein